MAIKIFSQNDFIVFSELRKGDFIHFLDTFNLEGFWFNERQENIVTIIKELFEINELLNDLPDTFVIDSIKFDKSLFKQKILSLIDFFEKNSGENAKIIF